MLSIYSIEHFSKNILEALREPLEDNKILISRVNSKTNYKTKFLFIGAMNPCPCGNLLSINRSCRCNEMEIKRYKSKISDPLLDRMDLYVSMQEEQKDVKALNSSLKLHEIVIFTFSKQKSRKQKNLNGKLSDEELEKFCILDDSCKEILDKAVTSYNLSQRSINKVKKVARTIADIDGLENIDKKSILKALSFRFR